MRIGTFRAGPVQLEAGARFHLRVVRCTGSEAETCVVTGGRLSERKGVNVPGAVLPLSALTDKDRRDLEFALSLGDALRGVGLRRVPRGGGSR